MKSYHVDFSPEAGTQLFNLYVYIAGQSSRDVADRFSDAIVEYCRGLEFSPYRGTSRDDLRPGLRTSSFKRRTIIAFVVGEDMVSIVGVFYGG